jgi:hypothetical protein
MLEIIEVKTKKDKKRFVEYPLKLYKGNPYFVPPLYGDEMKMFTDKNIYSKTCDSAFFLAVRDGVVVGRIQAIIQKQYNEIHNEKQVRFTRFDSENNVETAKNLFETVENWAHEKGMEKVVGPLGYSDLEREGLLIEGFEELSTFEEQYSYDYYPALVEGCGYVKDVDWVESKLYKSDDPTLREKVKAITEHALKKFNLHIAGEGLSKRAYIKKYKEGIFKCIDECYKDLYGTVPFTEEMINQMVEQFMLILNLKYIMTVCDENENVVAFGFCMPSISKAVQKSGGRLTPCALVKLLKAVRNPEIIDLALIGIMPKYRKSGLSAIAIDMLQTMLEEGNVKYCETNLNLETNANIQSQWKHFKSVQHKRRRSYIKVL